MLKSSFFTLLLLLAVFVGSGFESHLAFFNDGVLDTFSTGEADPRFDTFTDAEDVTGAGRELVTSAILQVNDIERTGVLLFGGDDTNTALIGTASEHGSVSDFEFDDTGDLARGDIDLHGVIWLGKRVRVADSATVVGDNERDGTSLTVLEGVSASGSFATVLERFDTAQFEFGFFGVLDTVEDETALVIVQETVLFISVGNTDNVHETSGVVHVSADFAVNLNLALHADDVGLTAVERQLQAVAQDQAKRKALTELVGSLGRSGSPDTVHLGQHPMLGSIESLQVLLRSARHFDKPWSVK